MLGGERLEPVNPAQVPAATSWWRRWRRRLVERGSLHVRARQRGLPRFSQSELRLEGWVLCLRDEVGVGLLGARGVTSALCWPGPACVGLFVLARNPCDRSLARNESRFAIPSFCLEAIVRSRDALLCRRSLYPPIAPPLRLTV